MPWSGKTSLYCMSFPIPPNEGRKLRRGGTGAICLNAHLEVHTAFDGSVGKSFGERLTVSATALNLTNRRFLLDNSDTFGGTHYADPRQIYSQIRYRFHY